MGLGATFLIFKFSADRLSKNQVEQPKLVQRTFTL